jgi:hypothetical protein
MKRYSSPAARGLAGVVALLMAFALAAPPALAGEEAGEVPSPTESQSFEPPTAERPTLVAMAEARVQSTDPADAVAPAQTSETSSGGSFIKSPQGIAAVALLVGGTILYAYSRKNDRPTSPVR